MSQGPNAYRVPHTIGRTVESNKRQAPSYSVKSRDKHGAIGFDINRVGLTALCCGFKMNYLSTVLTIIITIIIQEW